MKNLVNFLLLPWRHMSVVQLRYVIIYIHTVYTHSPKPNHFETFRCKPVNLYLSLHGSFSDFFVTILCYFDMYVFSLFLKLIRSVHVLIMKLPFFTQHLCYDCCFRCVLFNSSANKLHECIWKQLSKSFVRYFISISYRWFDIFEMRVFIWITDTWKDILKMSSL